MKLSAKRWNGKRFVLTDWQIELLRSDHVRSEFSCGVPSLDNFLRQLATQYAKRNLGKTYVATQPGSRTVDGYYTILASSVPFESLPDELSRKLPFHPVPVVKIGRLAVSDECQGNLLGEKLLLDSLQRTVLISLGIGIYAVQVHAINDGAASFYRKYGFAPIYDQPHHLFLPLSKIAHRSSPS
jgi:GNAT superfamily N-acetyltransferase